MCFLHFRWDYVQDGTTVKKDMDRLTAFYKGLSTWARWVDTNIDPSKTKVFFQGISPTHYQLVIFKTIELHTLIYYKKYFDLNHRRLSNIMKIMCIQG